MNANAMSIARRSAHLLGCALLVLAAGCAEMPATGAFGSQFPANDPADPCNGQLQALRPDYEYFRAPLATKAASDQMAGLIQNVGMALMTGRGGTLGANQQMESFAKNLIQATISEATKSYLTSIGGTGASVTDLAYRVDSDATGHSQRLAGVRTKITALEKCRRKQADDIEGSYKRGRITKKEAITRFEDLQTVVKRDNAVIEKIIGGSRERIVVYTEADRFLIQQPKATRKKTSRGVTQATTAQKKAEQAQGDVAALDQVIDGQKSGIVG